MAVYYVTLVQAIIPSHETIPGDKPSSSTISTSNRLQPEEVAKTVEEALQALQLNDFKDDEEEEVNKEDNDFATISEEPITFSDDELVAALWGIDNTNNSTTTTSQEEAETEEENYYNNNNNNDWNGWLEPLPDIDLDFGESFNNKDSVEFLDPEHLGSIFDSHHEEDNNYYTGEEENIPPESSSLSFLDDNDEEEEESAFLDLDTEVLYSELARLTLLNNNNNGEEIGPTDPTLYSEESTDGLPSYLYCQPCETNSSEDDDDDYYNNHLISQFYPPIDESDDDDEYEPSKVQDNEDDFFLQDLMKLSSLQLEDNHIENEEEEQYTTTMEDSYDYYHDDDEQQQEQQQPQSTTTTTPVRKEAWDAANGMLKAFGVVNNGKNAEQSCLGHGETIFGVSFSECGQYCATASQDSTIKIWNVKNHRLLASLNDHSNEYECLRVVWASSTWSNNVLLDRRNTNFRHLLASSGADGTVRLWACQDPTIPPGQGDGGWKCYVTLEHDFHVHKTKTNKASLDTIAEDDDDTEESKQQQQQDNDEPDKPQVYALQFIDHWKAFNTTNAQNSFLMTSSDDYIHLWELDVASTFTMPKEGEEQTISLKGGGDSTSTTTTTLNLKEVMSLHFGSLQEYGFGVTVANVTGAGLPVFHSTPSSNNNNNTTASGPHHNFGGDRNPDNVIFVFDAAYCPANGLLGVALSDGSLRLMNGRGICVSILNLPGCQSHLTSFTWDYTTGNRLATCVATGHLITWQLDWKNHPAETTTTTTTTNMVAVCTAIMEGGHSVGRPLFGCRYCGGGGNENDDDNENLLVSWSVDGSLCLWDSHSQGNVQSPMAILKQQDDNYPIYAVEVYKNSCMIVAGGGSEGGFIGIPVYLYSYNNESNPSDKSRQQKLLENGTTSTTTTTAANKAASASNESPMDRETEERDQANSATSRSPLDSLSNDENSNTKLNVEGVATTTLEEPNQKL